jgi:iron complex transport system substrate-binding protein
MAVALMLALTGCTSSSSTASYTISADQVSSISLSAKPNVAVSRVVVLANGVAEIIEALNAKEILVGRDISSTEKSLADIPIVTSGHQVLPEKILALSPDLVIIDSATGPKSALDQLRKAGIKILVTPDSWTLADIAPKVRAVGVAVGAIDQAEQLISEIENSLSFAKLSKRVRVAFLYLRGTSSIYLIGGPGSGADSLLQSIGAIDVGAENLANPFNTLTAESLATLNPDVILVMSKGLESVGGISGLIKLPGVAQTKAGKSSAVIDVDDSLLLSFGPRTPALVKELANALNEVAP